jgi:hypothetical protein
LSTTELHPETEVQEPLKTPDQRIAELEERIRADQLRSVREAEEVEARVEKHKRSRRRRQHAWQFGAGLALGVAATLLISASIDEPRRPLQLGPGSLAVSLGEHFPGAPFDCKQVGGAFECLQPSATGGLTLQVRLDYRGCWEAKPNTAAEFRAGAHGGHGCIAAAPRPGGSTGAGS